MQARALSLNSAITRMEQILRRTIGEQIELVITLAPNLPMILADPGQIEQIVLNLAINARDAMPSGGTLSIDTAVIETLESETSVTGVPPGLYVRFRVSDTGIGMSAEVRDQSLRTVLHNQAQRRGLGSRVGDGLRNRAAVRWLFTDLLRRGDRNLNIHTVACLRR